MVILVQQKVGNLGRVPTEQHRERVQEQVLMCSLIMTHDIETTKNKNFIKSVEKDKVHRYSIQQLKDLKKRFV